MDITGKVSATVKIMGIELVALKKLSLVSHMLAKKIGGSAGEEQKCLASVLDNVIRQLEIGAATASYDQSPTDPHHGGKIWTEVAP
jgi:hypothetical protein